MSIRPMGLSPAQSVLAGSATYVSLDPAGGLPQTIAAGKRIRIEAAQLGMAIGHASDLTDQPPYDVIDVTNRGTGDGVYVYMLGGRKLGYAGTGGDGAGVTVTVPRMLNGSGDYDGSVANTNLAIGVKAAVYASGAGSIPVYVVSHSDAPAIDIANQPSVGANPVGGGMALRITDQLGTNDLVSVSRSTLPTGNTLTNPKAGKAMVRLRDASSVNAATPSSVLKIDDDTGTRFMIDTLGVHRWAQFNGTTYSLAIGPLLNGGGLKVQGGALDLQDNADGAGAATPANGIRKYPGNNILEFYTQSGLVMEMRNGSRIGFYGTTNGPTKQTVTGSRGGNAALASLLTGLAALGLFTDSSTA